MNGATASSPVRLASLSLIILQVVRDPYRLWLWLQVPLWLLVAGWVWQGSLQWLDRPLRQIEVAGDFVQLDAALLEQQLWQQLAASEQALSDAPLAAGEMLPEPRFAARELSSFKQLLEQQAWVNEVEIRRRWPDRLQVRVREEHPVARWGEQGLINQQGRIFSPQALSSSASVADFASLPLLNGPEHRSRYLMTRFRDFNQILRPLGVSLIGLDMAARGAWTMQLNNGIRLLVGRGQVIDKLHRFSRVYGSVLQRYAERIEQVDVRYTNGLAVTWREPPLKK